MSLPTLPIPNIWLATLETPLSLPAYLFPFILVSRTSRLLSSSSSPFTYNRKRVVHSFLYFQVLNFKPTINNYGLNQNALQGSCLNTWPPVGATIYEGFSFALWGGLNVTICEGFKLALCGGLNRYGPTESCA